MEDSDFIQPLHKGPLDGDSLYHIPEPLGAGTPITSHGALCDIGRAGSSHAGYTRVPMHWPLNDIEARKLIQLRFSAHPDYKSELTDHTFQFSWGLGPTLERREGAIIYAYLRCRLPKFLQEGTADIPLGYNGQGFQKVGETTRILIGGLKNVADRNLHRQQKIVGHTVSCSFMSSFSPCMASIAPPTFKLCENEDAINFALKGGMS